MRVRRFRLGALEVERDVLVVQRFKLGHSSPPDSYTGSQGRDACLDMRRSKDADEGRWPRKPS